MGDTGLELNSQKSSQPLENKDVKDAPCPTPKHKTVHNTVHKPEICPELQQIIDHRDSLPEHIKAAIKALIQTHITE